MDGEVDYPLLGVIRALSPMEDGERDMSESSHHQPRNRTTSLLTEGTERPACLPDIYRFRWLFIGISLLFLLPGIYFMAANWLNPDIRAPLRLGLDFQGGTLLAYGFSRSVGQQDIPAIRRVFDHYGYTGSIIQVQQPHAGLNTNSGATRPAVQSATPGVKVPSVSGDALIDAHRTPASLLPEEMPQRRRRALQPQESQPREL